MGDQAGVVYLHTFPKVPHVYNISPFAIKVESFLRMNKIPYEMIYTTDFGPTGLIPYIKLNGEFAADSNSIIRRLKEVFGIVEVYPSELLAVGHMMMRMLEEHTAQIGFYYRYALHMYDFCDALDVPKRMFRKNTSMKGCLSSWLWKNIMPSVHRNAMKTRRLAGFHSDEELWRLSFADLTAISAFLGEKTYLLGEKPSTEDCVLFGHICQFLYIPIDFPQKGFLLESCPNIVRFMERFRAEFWPDWLPLCEVPSGA